MTNLVDKTVMCKTSKTRNGKEWSWELGTVMKDTEHFLLVDLGLYKECFLQKDKGDTWKDQDDYNKVETV